MHIDVIFWDCRQAAYIFICDLYIVSFFEVIFLLRFTVPEHFYQVSCYPSNN